MKVVSWYFFIFFFCVSVSVVEANVEKEQLVLVVVPDFSFEEVQWLIQEGDYEQLWTKGSLAGVNVRPDGPYSYLNNIVSLSTGSRGVGVQDWNAFERGELFLERPVEQVVEQWTGQLPNREVIHPLFHILQQKNEETTYEAPIGSLGETLKENQIMGYVLGHSDRTEEKVRYGSLFVMDGTGEANGKLSNMITYDSKFPHGMKMNMDNLLIEINKIYEQHAKSFVVVEWGDVARLYSEKKMMDSSYFRKMHQETLLNLEIFMKELLKAERRDVLLLSPMMHQEAYAQYKRLAPLWVWLSDPPYAERAFTLTSHTTRQAHLVSNVDIAPFILQRLDVDAPSRILGNPVQLVNNREVGPNEVIRHMDWLFTIFSSRSVVLSSYITLLVLLLITVSIMLWRNRASRRLRFAAKILLIAAISSPFWLLITAKLLAYVNVSLYFWTMTLLSFLTGYVLIRFFRYPIFLVGMLHFTMITLDLLLGSPFMQRSYLGYDPIIGARYYGIGNEYAGVFIVSFFFIMLPMLKKPYWVQRIAILILGSIFVFLLGASALGTNAGATLASGIAIGFLYYQATVSNKSFRRLLGLLLGLLFLLVMLLFIMQLTGAKTHIGHAFQRLLSGDITFILDTIKRKAAMNWKIFKFSNWTQLFVTSYLLVGILLWRQKRLITERTQKLVLQSGIVASVALLLLNDSGVVAAATSMFLIVSASLYWILDEKKEEIKKV